MASIVPVYEPSGLLKTTALATTSGALSHVPRPISGILSPDRSMIVRGTEALVGPGMAEEGARGVEKTAAAAAVDSMARRESETNILVMYRKRYQRRA